MPEVLTRGLLAVLLAVSATNALAQDEFLDPEVAFVLSVEQQADAATLQAHDHERLQQTMHLAPHAQRAHPTTEHLWPLLVAAGAAGAGQTVTRIDGGMTHGVLSMDAFVFGDTAVAA